TAHLVENASITLPGETGKKPKQISARGIDVGMAPDGATVTNLTANESVELDIPADGDVPQRRIRAAALMAAGAAPGGITHATCAGEPVDFRESRPAKGKLAAIDRTARSQKLDVKTKPGFGDLESAEFHGNVHFTDGAETTADAPLAVYALTNDTLDLSPGQADPGGPPHLANGRITGDARSTPMGRTSQKMKAETQVRSRMIQQSKDAKKDDQVRMPSMLKQDKPVNVRSNRLDYDGDKSVAVYSGKARLWQEETDIQADTIVLE